MLTMFVIDGAHLKYNEEAGGRQMRMRKRRQERRTVHLMAEMSKTSAKVVVNYYYL